MPDEQKREKGQILLLSNRQIPGGHLSPESMFEFFVVFFDLFVQLQRWFIK
jgi:hypothetical protein